MGRADRADRRGAAAASRSPSIPETERVGTAAARAALPAAGPPRGRGSTAGRATLLGAAIAERRRAELFAAALDDRLHEPYRAANAPLLAAIRDDLPAGAVGATMSGSGPTVIVWAGPDAVDDCAAELTARFPAAQVLPLADRDQRAPASF